MMHFQKYCFIIISALICMVLLPCNSVSEASDSPENMPEKFSLHDPDINIISDAGNQGEYNTCWAYSALGSIQTQLKKKG